MKNIILVEGNDEYEVDTIEELVRLIINSKYYEMTVEEKKRQLHLKAVANCMRERIGIINEWNDEVFDDNQFIAIDEITFIYSLLNFNKIILLEKTSSNILTKEMDKSNISDNYIMVNKFSKTLLNKYLESKNTLGS